MPPFLAPLVAGLAASMAAWRWSAYPSFEQLGEVLSFGGSIAAIGTTMLGFMLAALAVLASINHTHLIGMMRKTGHYRDLLQTLFTGCAIILLCAIGGFMLLFGLHPQTWFYIALIGLHFAALASVLDIGRKFWLVLANLSEAST